MIEEAEAMEHYLSKSTVELMSNLIEFMEQNSDIRKKFKNFVRTNNVMIIQFVLFYTNPNILADYKL